MDCSSRFSFNGIIFISIYGIIFVFTFAEISYLIQKLKWQTHRMVNKKPYIFLCRKESALNIMIMWDVRAYAKILK